MRRLLPQSLLPALLLLGCAEAATKRGPQEGDASERGGGPRAATSHEAGAAMRPHGDRVLDGGQPGAPATSSEADPRVDAGVDASRQQAPENLRGAALPYVELEAEDARSNGVLLAPSRSFGEIAAESSGRRAVRLEERMQHVTFTTPRASNTLVLRYVLPDAPGGGGIEATLSLYVDGRFRQKLRLSSRFAWVYGGESASNDVPGAGAHHFYDEVRAKIGDVAQGATLSLQKDADDAAPYYVIDLIDLEQVGPALPRPAGSLAITEYGATSDDDSDDSAAIQRALDAGKSQEKTVWIPAGTFQLRGAPLRAAGVTVRGAGMWHATLEGPSAQFKLSGGGHHFSDFALFGAVTTRRDEVAENAFDGPAGADSVLENLWLEHHKVGFWVGRGDAPTTTRALTERLLVRGVRVRNTFADGINLCNGTVDSTVEHSHFRNTGDDALATWSPAFDGPSGARNVFRFNTIELPWRASCIAVYGGADHRIEDNRCSDPLLYPGILVSTTFSPHPFAGKLQITRNALVRAGGPMYAQQHGALKIFADTLDIAGIEVRDLSIEQPTFAGIHVQGPKLVRALSLENVEITRPGTSAIQIDENAQGSASARGVVVREAASGLQNRAGTRFTFERGGGNLGW